MSFFVVQVDKHIPMHLRRKARQERQKPRTFEMIPATGSLMPGQRVNVQVKFMPTEEVSIYQTKVVNHPGSAPSQFWAMAENSNLFLLILK